jgi:hypothetical protein
LNSFHGVVRKLWLQLVPHLKDGGTTGPGGGTVIQRAMFEAGLQTYP